jgi:hypothetical protein
LKNDVSAYPYPSDTDTRIRIRAAHKTTAIHGRKLHLDLINYLFWGIDLTNYLRGPVHNTSKVD